MPRNARGVEKMTIFLALRFSPLFQEGILLFFLQQKPKKSIRRMSFDSRESKKPKKKKRKNLRQNLNLKKNKTKNGKNPQKKRTPADVENTTARTYLFSEKILLTLLGWKLAEAQIQLNVKITGKQTLFGDRRSRPLRRRGCRRSRAPRRNAAKLTLRTPSRETPSSPKMHPTKTRLFAPSRPPPSSFLTRFFEKAREVTATVSYSPRAPDSAASSAPLRHAQQSEYPLVITPFLIILYGECTASRSIPQKPTLHPSPIALPPVV